MGDMALGQGQYKSAEDLYSQALTIFEKAFGPEGEKTALALNNLVSVFWFKGEYTKAEPMGRRSVAIYEKALGPDHPATANALNSLASTLTGEKKYSEAETLLRRVAAIREKAQGPSHPDTAVAINNLGMLYMLQGRYRDADPLERRALSIVENTFGVDHPNASLALGNLFISAWAQGNAREALANLRREVQSEENQLRLNLAFGSESARLAYAQRFASVTDAVLTFSAAQDNPEIRGFAFETLTARKSRVLDSLTDQFASIRRRLDAAARGRLDELTEVRARQARLLFNGSDGNPAATRRLMDAAKQREEELVRDLSAVSADFRERTTTATLADIQRALPKGTVMVEYSRYSPFNFRTPGESGPDRYGAFVLRAEGDPRWVDLGEAAPIDASLAQYRTLISERDSSGVNAAGEQLSRRLLMPVLALAGQPQSLLIAPDAALQLVPWSALPVDSRTPLLTRYSVSLLDTARDLIRLNAAGLNPRSEGIVIANPSFDSTPARIEVASVEKQRSRDFSQQKWGALLGTHREALALRDQLHLLPEQVLEEARATRVAVLAVHGPRFLHIATHGFFLPDQPRATTNAGARGFSLPPLASANLMPEPDGEENPLLRSGLVFAGANVPASGVDSLLTALEASQLDLDGTELVTLSACETGVGTTATGEGVFGLRRAISLAGARSQLISLWEIDDDSTALLMKNFYGYLQAGESRAAALNHAQRDVARVHDSPYYWAAFQLAGDPGPVRPTP